MAKINPKSAIPLPLQIKEDIRTRIIAGQREFKKSKTVVIPTKLVIRQSCGLQK
ncbi:MAG: hypothetical protein V2A65_10640 [Candidatus Omnitrophota bacterium]